MLCSETLSAALKSAARFVFPIAHPRRARESSARLLVRQAGAASAARPGAAPVRMSVTRTIVRSCRWPRLRFEFLRRRFLNAMTLGPRVCSTISPTTLAPATCGAPTWLARAVEQRQHLVEHDPRAGLARQRHDGDAFVGGDRVLLAAGLDDCEHRFFPCSARLVARARAAGFFAVGPKSRLCQTAGLTLGFEALSTEDRLKTKSAALWPRSSEAGL